MPSRAMALAGVVVAALFRAAPSPAQISPGDLAEAHGEIDGTRNCTRCHGDRAEEMDPNCLRCHREIRDLMDAGRGLHARLGEADCASCHPDHGGRDFELVFWKNGSPEAFDHRGAGWPLTGKHLEQTCRTCHTSRYQVGNAVKTMKRRHPESSWLGLETDCRSCHRDPHAGSFGPTCSKCHGTVSFNEVNQDGFAHELTRFPLRGRHAGVSCASCHDPETAWGKKPAFDRCAACHADPHGGKVGLTGKRVDCASCHDEEGFRPSTFTVAGHARSAYPLEGKHRDVACASCHPGAGKRNAPVNLRAAGVNLHPVHETCRSCHADAHAGQLASRPDRGACESCHTVEGWIPSLFAVKDHAATAFALEGRHTETACRSCHGPKRAGLPPLPGSEVTGKAGVMLTLGRVACTGCHLDPHEGRFRENAADCTACHSQKSFHRVELSVADHARFSFPLEGAHRAIPCVMCHRELEHEPGGSALLLAATGVPSLPFSGNRRACEDCHRTPHEDQFSGGEPARTCDACHGLESFRPASRFDHDRDAAFSLKGSHERVACDRCHPSRVDSDGTRHVLYRPLSTSCKSCHGGSMP